MRNLGARRGFRGQDETNDQAVQAERLSENQDEHHADVQLGLLRRSTHASVTNDANSNASGHTAEAASEASGKVRIAGERRVLRHSPRRRRDAVRDDDCNDKAVNAALEDHG